MKGGNIFYVTFNSYNQDRNKEPWKNKLLKFFVANHIPSIRGICLMMYIDIKILLVCRIFEDHLTHFYILILYIKCKPGLTIDIHNDKTS